MDYSSGTLKQNTEVQYPVDYDASLNGIGGWLIFVIIGRILTIIIGIKDIFDSSSAYGHGSEFDTLLTAAIIIEIVFGIIFSIIILNFIFTRNILFRTFFVIQVLVTFAFYIFLTIYFSNLGVNYGTPSLIGSIVGGVIWILYVYKSKRIKNTYIYSKQYPDLY